MVIKKMDLKREEIAELTALRKGGANRKSTCRVSKAQEKNRFHGKIRVVSAEGEAVSRSLSP